MDLGERRSNTSRSSQWKKQRCLTLEFPNVESHCRREHWKFALEISNEMPFQTTFFVENAISNLTQILDVIYKAQP